METPKKADFMKALEILKQEKREAGEEFFELKAGDFHKMVWDYKGRSHRMKLCCLAMYDSMGANDEIVQMPGHKNCLLGLEVKNMDNEENKIKVKKMLEKYGLTNFKRHYPSQLSGGMRQRAALVRTLAIEPDLLLLDEPFSALDYQTRLSIGDEVGTILRNEKISTILVTHDIPEAVSISDRVIVFTERPAKIKKEYEIIFDDCPGERTPMKCRNTLTFGKYFRDIWRDLDVEKEE
jgi:ABC-type nitrate/sulfonate/bicarbonate transport system ATPase subunit